MAPVDPCPERAVLDLLLRGELAAPASAQLAGHLKSCDRCAAVVRELAAHELASVVLHSSVAAVLTGMLSLTALNAMVGLGNALPAVRFVTCACPDIAVMLDADSPHAASIDKNPPEISSHARRRSIAGEKLLPE